jgi:hypothetical protein
MPMRRSGTVAERKDNLELNDHLPEPDTAIRTTRPIPEWQKQSVVVPWSALYRPGQHAKMRARVSDAIPCK